MISPDSRSTCFPNDHQSFEMLVSNDQQSAAGMSASSSMEYTTTTTTTTTNTSDSDAHLNSILCSLSLLKDKVNQVQSMATSVSCSSLALAGMATLIQEIVVTASSMMFNCQQLAIAPPPTTTTTGNNNNHNNTNTLPVIYGYDDDDHLQDTGAIKKSDGQYENGGMSTNFLASEAPFYWYNNDNTFSPHAIDHVAPTSAAKSEPENYDIIEIDAAELLAKYTHYCQVCGKGFKRDANLRMHMRAHGDEYKSSAALSNPLKGKDGDNDNGDDVSRQIARKYSCPQEGCRWNKKHAKFQPLKSMVCVKNHYKRSHCPKMYMCNRCNRKQFSVLSDLRTHEKHCGDLRWRCSCGTTFSRKDKLMGHVALFVGHSPVGLPAGKLPRNNTLP